MEMTAKLAAGRALRFFVFPDVAPSGDFRDGLSIATAAIVCDRSRVEGLKFRYDTECPTGFSDAARRSDFVTARQGGTA
jgi:hypothetical protein